MAKRKIKHELIANPSKRNATYAKRTEGLIKKANELSTLCGVDVALIVHNKQGQEDNAIVWPSSSIFRERIHKFLDLSDFEQTRRMVEHEKYMEQQNNEEAESSSRLKKRIQIQESQQVMNELVTTQSKSFHELGLYELNGLSLLADEMLGELRMRDYELDDEQQLQPWDLLPSPLPTVSLPSAQQQAGGETALADPLEGLGDDDQWLIEAMSEEHHVADLLEAVPLDDDRGAASYDGGDGETPPAPS